MSLEEIQECDHGFEEGKMDVEYWKTFDTDKYHVLQLQCMCWVCGKNYIFEVNRSKQTDNEQQTKVTSCQTESKA